MLLLGDRAVGECAGEQGGVVHPQAELVVLQSRQLCNDLRDHKHHLSICNRTGEGRERGRERRERERERERERAII